MNSTVCTNPVGCHEISKAAYRGHLECLRYLHEKGYSWNEEATDHAAFFGHLECLRYLHEEGCPCNERTIAEAAAGGQLECLRYLHESGCLWDASVWSICVTWLKLDQREHVHRSTPAMIKLRPSDGYLLDNDAPLPSDLNVRKHLLATPAGIRQLARERERQQAERDRREAAEQAERERQQVAQQAERERQQAAQRAERERQQAAQQAAQQATLSDRKKAFLAGEKPLSYVFAKATLQAERERQQAAQQADLLLQVTTGDIKQALHLVRNGETDLTLTNGDEETALHLASRLGQRGVLLALLKAGADPEIVNIHGDRPVDLAKDSATHKCFHTGPPQRPANSPGPHRSVPPHGTNPFMSAETRPKPSATQSSSSSSRALPNPAPETKSAPVRDIATSLVKLKEFASETSQYHSNNGTVVALRWLGKALASETPYDPAQLREYVAIVSDLAADQSRRLHDADPANTKPTIRWSEHHGLSPETSRAKVVKDMKSAHAIAVADPDVPVHVTFNTGKDNNSQVKGDPVLRPLVERMLQDYERIPDPNTGLIIVRVRPNTPNRVRQ